jgi:undecaprenyl-diphosphatase
VLKTGSVLAVLFLLLALSVGRHPVQEAPRTTLPVIGRIDLAVADAMPGIRAPVLTGTARVLDIAGKGVVSTPLGLGVLLVLCLRRRTDLALAFALAWLGSEAAQHAMKAALARGRPPAAVVVASGFAFPSGHATTAAVFAASMVLILPAAFPSRRWWGVSAAAVVLALAMAFSRVLLGVHWTSDVIGGSLLGAWCALLAFGSVCRHRPGTRSPVE